MLYSHGPASETPKNQYLNYISYDILRSRFFLLDDEDKISLQAWKEIRRLQAKVGDIEAHLRKILLSSRLPPSETPSHQFDRSRQMRGACTFVILSSFPRSMIFQIWRMWRQILHLEEDECISPPTSTLRSRKLRERFQRCYRLYFQESKNFISKKWCALFDFVFFHPFIH